MLTFMRKDGADYVIVVLNFAPVPRENCRIGVPIAGLYVKNPSSDDIRFGGSEYQTTSVVETDPIAAYGRRDSIERQLPPLGCFLLLAPTK